MAGNEPRISQNYSIPIVGGVTTGLNNVSTTAAQVIAASNNRKSLLFHNPGTVNLLLFQKLNSAGTAQAVTFAAPGGGFLLLPYASMPVEGDSAGGAWMAVAASGSANGLTITESTQ
jgi:hypothetical protein